MKAEIKKIDKAIEELNQVYWSTSCLLVKSEFARQIRELCSIKKAMER